MDLHTSCLSTRGSVLAEGDVTVRLTCRDLHRRSRRARRPRREPRRDVARSDTTQGPTYPGDGGTTSASIHNRPPLSPPSPLPCLCSLSGRGLALAHSRGSACVCARGSHTHTHTHNTYDSTHCTPPFLCLCFECTTSRLFADHGPGFKATGRCSRGSARLYRGTFAGECRHRREGGVPALQQLEDVTRPIMST